MPSDLQPSATQDPDHAGKDDLWTIGRGAVGRAEFVRLVYRVGLTGERGSVAAQLLQAGLPPDIAAELVGLERRSEKAAVVYAGQTAPPKAPATAEELPPSEPAVVPMPVWRAIGPTVTAEAEQPPNMPEFLRKQGYLGQIGSSAAQATPPRPLIPTARLGCVLRQRLMRLGPSGHIDERKLVHDLARARQLVRLPLAQRKAWPRRLQVYLDRARSIAFCLDDQVRVIQWLERWVGKTEVERCFTDGLGPAVRYRGKRILAPSPIEPQTSILALSDLGVADGHRERQAYWSRLAADANRVGASLVALVLAPRFFWPRGFASGWSTAEWEHARPLRRDSSGVALINSDRIRRRNLAETLITLLAPTQRIEPGLLREVRALLKHAGADFGTELVVWNDRRIETRSSEGAALSAEARLELREKYREIDEPLRRRFEQLLRIHHRYLSPLILAEELRYCAPRGENGKEPTLIPGSPDEQLYHDAIAIWEDYARRLKTEGVGSDTEAAYIRRLTQRCSVDDWASQPLANVWGFANLNDERTGFNASIPEGLHWQDVAHLLRRPGEPRWARIWQQGPVLGFEPLMRRDAPFQEPKGSVLAVVPLRHRQIAVRRTDVGQTRPRTVMLNLDQYPCITLPDQPNSVLRIETDLGALQLNAELRPSWAKSLRRDRHGLWVKTDLVEFDWIQTDDWHALMERSSRRTILASRPIRIDRLLRERFIRWPEWAERLERDDHGLVATLRLAPDRTMRLRYIPPGRFLMGSPTDEPERDPDENQHWVTLSSGLWLAETACTQAQWVAVTGENPSCFKGSVDSEDCPVEQVSWDDCQRFCGALNDRHPTLGARLPTEAEWEYACRAGTATPFNLGANISPEQVNYDGNYPYAGAAKGLYRERTLSARSFEPNGWGLYQMHGNVWEWCMDWHGAYTGGEQRDPVGAAEGQDRVIRGGGWSSRARYCRSAYRFRFEPGFRWNDLGFRLAAVQPGEPGR